MLTNRNQNKFAEFLEKLHEATGNKSFKFEDIIQGIVKIGIDCEDWKGMFDLFLREKHLIKEDNRFKLGKLFDYLEDHNPEELIFEEAISCLTNIGLDLVPDKIRMTLSLPEQVSWILNHYKEIICKTKK